MAFDRSVDWMSIYTQAHQQDAEFSHGARRGGRSLEVGALDCMRVLIVQWRRG